MGVIVRRPIGVRMLVGVLLVWMIVFVVTVIVMMTVLRAIGVRMGVRVLVALHDWVKFNFSSSASRLRPEETRSGFRCCLGNQITRFGISMRSDFRLTIRWWTVK